jgi:transcriptional regulator with XRE-family HTH domain
MVYPNIRALREDRDLRQREIAEVLCVSQNTYSQYENGVIEFTAEKLIRLADYYNVSVDYLLGRTENARPWKE